jgi:uracil-DNA glycosylase
MTFTPPPHNCNYCPRLAAFHAENRETYPDFHNGPVPSFGNVNAEFLVVGLAPGLKGANRTGRPFTGDYAGLVLYGALQKHGFAKGQYDPEKMAKGGDGFQLVNCRITNAVRCVPPQNKPEPSEIKQCNRFLASEIGAMPNLKVILSLGLVSHKGVLMALGQKQSAFVFAHGGQHKIASLSVINSYHCSRYNINTRTLTEAMFDEVMGSIKKRLG